MNHSFFMEMALQLAEEAALRGEIPVGAVVVCNNRVIGKGSNQTEQLHDVTAHAEIIAASAASQFLGSKFLKDCTLYVTLEPCVMCAGALYWFQLGRLVYATSDEKRGFSRLKTPVLHPKTICESGVLQGPAEAILKDFFRKLR